MFGNRKIFFSKKKVIKITFLPFPFLILLTFIWYLMPWISFRKFDKEMNTLCLANLISINKSRNPYSVFIGSSRVRRGIEPQLIFNKSEINGDPSLNLGLQGKNNIRAFTIIENLYKAGIKPRFVLYELNTRALYKDSLVKENENLSNKKYREEFIETYFLNKYLEDNLNQKDIKNANKKIKKEISMGYFSNASKISANKLINRIYVLNKISKSIRAPFSKKLFLEEPKIYSYSFKIPIIFSTFTYAQRFLYGFNRVFEESYHLALKSIIPTQNKQGLWLGDICWLKRYGSREYLEDKNFNLKNFSQNKNYSFTNKNRKILEDSWIIHNNLRDKAPVIMKDLSEYPITKTISKFGFGIPGLDYENAILGNSNTSKFDLEIISMMRELVERNDGEFILIKMPMISDRYPSYKEFKQIKSLYPEFIYPPKSLHLKLNNKENYADPNHFNKNGRYIFSKWLNNQLSYF